MSSGDLNVAGDKACFPMTRHMWIQQRRRHLSSNGLRALGFKWISTFESVISSWNQPHASQIHHLIVTSTMFVRRPDRITSGILNRIWTFTSKWQVVTQPAYVFFSLTCFIQVYRCLPMTFFSHSHSSKGGNPYLHTHTADFHWIQFYTFAWMKTKQQQQQIKKKKKKIKTVYFVGFSKMIANC